MNEFSLQNLVKEKFDEYRLFINGGPPYSALVRLGEVYNCIDKLDKPEQFQWLERLKAERLSETQMQSAVVELKKEINSIEHLLSAFTVWIFEELVLILTLRIQVDLVIVVLEMVEYKQVDVDLKHIDERLFEISTEKSSRSAFKAAVDSIRKNWGMPISNSWLKT